MQKITFLGTFILMVAFSFTACKKKSKAPANTNTTTSTTFEVDVPITKTKTFTEEIPVIPASIPYPGLLPLKDTFATKTDEMLATYAQGIGKDKIISIIPTAFSVVIDNTTPQTFDFVDDSVNVYIDKYNGTTPILIAKAKAIAAGAKSIDFAVTSTDIKDLFYNEFLQFELKFGTKANQGMKKNTVFISNMKFKVKAYNP